MINKRARLTQPGNTPAKASMPICPRHDCTYAPHKKVAPTRQNIAASSCQSDEALKKYRENTL
jgi:hypothetical protein